MVVDDVLASDVPTRALLLRSLPSYVSLQLVGSLMCSFGKVQVNLVHTFQHGLTAIVQFHTTESALLAKHSMSGRIYLLEIAREPGAVGAPREQQWIIRDQDIVFARCPITPVQLPHTQIRLIGRSNSSSSSSSSGGSHMHMQMQTEGQPPPYALPTETHPQSLFLTH
jgi:hypothetical protein